MEKLTFQFEPIHIDAVRNATDDFNLFHDKQRWQEIAKNPFGGAIALGFQLECLIAHQMRKFRGEQDESERETSRQLRFINYQFTFADAVRCRQPFSVEIKKSRFQQTGARVLQNRVLVKSDKRLALIGFVRETDEPLYLADADLPAGDALVKANDRAYLPGTGFFYKRKFASNSNAKNLLCGSCVEQSDYFDELEDRIDFPELYPVSLISCALLEKAKIRGHDFIREPMVYSSHKISVDRNSIRKLKSHDMLHLLVRERAAGGSGAIGHFDCFGLCNGAGVLFRAEIELMPLSAILA